MGELYLVAEASSFLPHLFPGLPIIWFGTGMVFIHVASLDEIVCLVFVYERGR